MDTPTFLMAMSQSTGSGAQITNYGTNSGKFAVTDHDGQTEAEGTNYSWHAGAGIYGGNGYLQSLTANGNKQVYLTTTATAPSQILETLNFAIGFRITGFSNNRFDPINPSTGAGGPWMSFNNPAGSGDFDMSVWKVDNSGSGTINATTLPTALTFGTDYVFSMSVNVTTPTATQALFKFGSNATQSPATANWSTFTLEAAWPVILRSYSLSTYFGILGRVNFIAFQRGGNAWTSTDLGTINSDPTQIPGWPSGGTNTTITPGIGSDNFSGNSPTVVNALNTVVAPFTARRSKEGLIVMERKKIFLPAWKKAA